MFTGIVTDIGRVRAGQEVFEKEIQQAGFQKRREERDLLKENYFVVFEKPLREHANPKSRVDARKERDYRP